MSEIERAHAIIPSQAGLSKLGSLAVFSSGFLRSVEFSCVPRARWSSTTRRPYSSTLSTLVVCIEDPTRPVLYSLEYAYSSTTYDTLTYFHRTKHQNGVRQSRRQRREAGAIPEPLPTAQQLNIRSIGRSVPLYQNSHHSTGTACRREWRSCVHRKVTIENDRFWVGKAVVWGSGQGSHM